MASIKTCQKMLIPSFNCFRTRQISRNVRFFVWVYRMSVYMQIYLDSNLFHLYANKESLLLDSFMSISIAIEHMNRQRKLFTQVKLKRTQIASLCKGPSINDVSSKGEGGVKNVDDIYLVKSRQRGREGVIKSENGSTLFMDDP